MKPPPLVSVLGLSLLGVLSSLCGSSACSSDQDTLDPGAGGGGGASPALGASAASGSGASGLVGSGGSVRAPDLVGGNSGDAARSCTENQEDAKLTPVNIVIMMDKSGSMGNGAGPGFPQNYDFRWAPVKAGMIAFFEGADTDGVSASLSYFPTGGDLAKACGSNYTDPDVALTDLKSPTKLVNSLNTTEPGGGTPTLSAIYGATTYAKGLMEKTPGSKSVVLLVTDGEPAMWIPEDETTGDLNHDGLTVGYTDPNCVPQALQHTAMQNVIGDVAQVVSDAATNAPIVPTYVVGIGPNLESLGEIADAGTTDLILVDDAASPDTTTAAIVAVLEGIRVKMFTCNLEILPPKEGKLDYDLVNVDFVHSDGTVESFGRSDSCSQPGWHYDVAPEQADTARPTHIHLCEQTCTAVQADPNGQLKLRLGCETLYSGPE